jgi:hypothetical protein
LLLNPDNSPDNIPYNIPDKIFNSETFNCPENSETCQKMATTT